jgi:hypothetical protein
VAVSTLAIALLTAVGLGGYALGNGRSAVSSSDHAQSDGVVNLTGLFGLFGPKGQAGISGARIQLLSSSDDRAFFPTGAVAITDTNGRFAFAVPASRGTTHYGFRFIANGFYPSAASRVLTVVGS